MGVILSLLIGYGLDLLLGDPDNWPHPVRVFGTAIARGETILNTGANRFGKGLLLVSILVPAVFLFFWATNRLLEHIHPWLAIAANGIWVWYGLANRSLIDEGRNVGRALEERGLEAGRKQLSRIVGRDTSRLTPHQIRTAVLETMSENLSDGVVAPLFYLAFAGVPGMMAYKMINTLDSMIGYRSERYEQFGKAAARLDDLANLIPARLTAFLMVLVTGSRRAIRFVFRYGRAHKSPNAGYPEAALAGILDCRFGGPNVYHGVAVSKPYIGINDRELTQEDLSTAISVNHRVCFVCILLIISIWLPGLF